MERLQPSFLQHQLRSHILKADPDAQRLRLRDPIFYGSYLLALLEHLAWSMLSTSPLLPRRKDQVSLAMERLEWHSGAEVWLRLKPGRRNVSASPRFLFPDHPSERVRKHGSIRRLKVRRSRSTISPDEVYCQISRGDCFLRKVQYGGCTGVLATLRRYAAGKERRETEDESVVGSPFPGLQLSRATPCQLQVF